MKIINKTFNKKIKEKTDDFLKMINQEPGHIPAWELIMKINNSAV